MTSSRLLTVLLIVVGLLMTGCVTRNTRTGAQLIPVQGGAPLLGPIEENAYGLGVHRDATGRPFQWAPRPSHNPTGFVDPLLQVTPNAYGPGIGMDQYGRPVQAQPWP